MSFYPIFKTRNPVVNFRLRTFFSASLKSCRGFPDGFPEDFPDHNVKKKKKGVGGIQVTVLLRQEFEKISDENKKKSLIGRSSRSSAQASKGFFNPHVIAAMIQSRFFALPSVISEITRITLIVRK